MDLSRCLLMHPHRGECLPKINQSQRKNLFSTIRLLRKHVIHASKRRWPGSSGRRQRYFGLALLRPHSECCYRAREFQRSHIGNAAHARF